MTGTVEETSAPTRLADRIKAGISATTRIDLSRIDLSRIDLSRIDLSRLDLSRLDLTRLDIGRIDFSLIQDDAFEDAILPWGLTFRDLYEVAQDCWNAYSVATEDEQKQRAAILGNLERRMGSAKDIQLINNIVESCGVEFFCACTKSVQHIALSGTQNATGAMFDAHFSTGRDPKLDVMVHQGFTAAARRVWEVCHPFLDPLVPITLTGHSLGGAIAVLLAYYCVKDGYDVSWCVTLGQPKLFPKRSIKALSKLAQVNILRICNQDDPVPDLPPHMSHVGSRLTLLSPMFCILESEKNARSMSLGYLFRRFLHGRLSFEQHLTGKYMEKLNPALPKVRVPSLQRALVRSDTTADFGLPLRVKLRHARKLFSDTTLPQILTVLRAYPRDAERWMRVIHATVPIPLGLALSSTRDAFDVLFECPAQVAGCLHTSSTRLQVSSKCWIHAIKAVILGVATGECVLHDEELVDALRLLHDTKTLRSILNHPILKLEELDELRADFETSGVVAALHFDLAEDCWICGNCSETMARLKRQRIGRISATHKFADRNTLAAGTSRVSRGSLISAVSASPDPDPDAPLRVHTVPHVAAAGASASADDVPLQLPKVEECPSHESPPGA